jgi:hypothetical protein
MDGILGRVMATVVGLLMIAGVVVAAQQMFGGSKASNATSDLLTLEQGIQGAYSAQPTFASLTNTVSNTAGWTPSDMNGGSGTATITNQWGGAVTVAVDTNTAQFDVTEQGVPSSACATIVNGAQNAVSVTANGTALTGPPYDPAALSASCNSSANTLKFVFSH